MKQKTAMVYNIRASISLYLINFGFKIMPHCKFKIQLALLIKNYLNNGI